MTQKSVPERVRPMARDKKVLPVLQHEFSNSPPATFYDDKDFAFQYKIIFIFLGWDGRKGCWWVGWGWGWEVGGTGPVYEVASAAG